jgi:hypothetical protein
MYTEVVFTKPFTFVGTVGMVTYSFTASPNVRGFLDDALADELVALDLAILVL